MSRVASTKATANCDADAGLTLIVVLAIDLAPAESITVSLKVNDVIVVACGAVNDAWTVLAPLSVTAGPAV